MSLRNSLLMVSGIVLAIGSLPAPLSAQPPVTPAVSSISPELRQQWGMDPFYQKCILAGALPIVSSTNTSDYALLEVRYLVDKMMSARPDILQALVERRVKVVVMAHNEYTTDLPEQRDMRPKAYWDSRARGMGGRTCSCAEENMLCFPNDPYSAENIFIHEFAHVVHGQAMRLVDPTFADRLRTAYTNAMAKGLWKGTYAATSAGEYWAEGVQDWFDNNRFDDALHNHIHTRAQLMEYDPELARLCREVYGDNEWRYQKPADRVRTERVHLEGYDFSRSPVFRWREVPMIDRPRVRFELAEGIIEAELYYKEAPVTVSNFLRYVHERLYNDGQFFRAVTLDNQPTNTVKIQVLQAEANPAKESLFYPPIPLERTCDTGLKHLDGSMSMAREGPDTAQASFSICIGDQPELDFGGRRNSDGQGFAVFGRVTRGMELVRRIHGGRTEGQTLRPAVRIQRAVRTE